MKKKNAIFLLLLLLSFSSNAQFSGSGSGTLIDPYQITSPLQLDELRNFLGTANTDVHFVLSNDIDLGTYIAAQYPDTGWEPIGSETESFYGHLDGQGHAITNLWINQPSANEIGLFGVIGGGEVSSLNIALDAQNGIKGHTNVGILAGTSQAVSITGCSVTGNLWVSYNAGGLTGYTRQDCFINSNTATVTITVDTFGENIGALTGLTESPVENCSASGNIYVLGSQGIVNNLGGLIGKSQALVKGCYSSVNLTNNGNAFVGSAIGGLAGQNYAPIEDSNASGDVTGAINIGGLVGDSYALVTNSYATGNVVAEAYAGGLVGSSDQVEDSYATGTVTINSEDGGGLIGHAYGAVLRCYAEGAVFGPQAIGGLIGTSENTVSLCYATGEVTGTVPAVMPDGGLTDIAGLIGHNYADVSNCYATGNVYAPENSICVGGAVGFAGNTVNNCYASGHVTTNSSIAGGLIGLSFAPIANCAANNPAVKGTSENTTSLRRVAGNLQIDATVTNCHALVSMRINGNALEGPGDENDQDGLSKEVADLQTEAFYKNQLGWDFDSVWVMREGQGYPYFGWKEYHTNIVSATVNNEDFGSIDPVGDIAFEKGSDAPFVITPKEGYVIDTVLIDGQDVGAADQYTFEAINANHTLQVTFIEQDLGLGDDEIVKGIIAFPNPVKNLVTIMMPEDSQAIIEMYTITGQRVTTGALNTSLQFDMSGLPEGMYILKAITESGSQSLKIIKE